MKFNVLLDLEVRDLSGRLHRSHNNFSRNKKKSEDENLYLNRGVKSGKRERRLLGTKKAV